MDINGMVQKNYVLDPKTDFEIEDGYELEDGMVVLLKDSRFRVDISNPSELSLDDYDKAGLDNRWAEISDVKIVSVRYAGECVVFNAKYEDGSVVERRFAVGYAWIAKRYNVEVLDGDVRLSRVGSLVHEAMMVQHKATLNGDPHSPLTLQTADDIVAKIIAIFE